MVASVSTKALFGSLAALFFCCCAGCDPPASTAGPPQTLSIKIGGQLFQLELALDQTSRVQGLSDRRELAVDGGMLFVFAQPRTLAFVMRRCYMPIDVIFLDPSGRVINIRQMTPEPNTPEAQLKRYASEWPAQYAIELAGGTCQRLGLKRRDSIDLPAADLKRWVR